MYDHILTFDYGISIRPISAMFANKVIELSFKIHDVMFFNNMTNGVFIGTN